MSRLGLVIAAFAASLVVPATASAADEIVIKRVPGLDRAERLAVRHDADVRLVDALTIPNAEVVRPLGDVDAALDALNANPDVIYAEVDSPVTPTTNDPYFGKLYGLENSGQLDSAQQAGAAGDDISAVAAWTRTQGAGATVAEIDTGILTTHPDLVGQFTGNAGERGNGRETNGIDDDGNGKVDDWQGWDFVNNDNTTETQNNGHGTHVAGTIAAIADNGTGVVGVAPEAKIVPVKVFGAPNSSASAAVLAQAFDYAGALGVPVVNASLGGPGNAEIVTDAIQAHPGTLYVVAAGNDGDDAANTYPCNSPAANVVCVGATDNRDQVAYFSNYSATYVDLFAPGVSILSSYLSDGYAYSDGTSMATPHVAGAAALLAALRPGATAAQAKQALIASADRRTGFETVSVAGGRLNANAALDALVTATAPPPAPTPTPTPVAPVAPPTPVAPVVPTPVTTPASPVVVTSLKLRGSVSKRTSAQVTYTLSGNAKVSVTVTRPGCKRVKRCSAAIGRWTESARTFTLGRRVAGRTLSTGRYTLSVAVRRSSRTVAFRVR